MAEEKPTREERLKKVNDRWEGLIRSYDGPRDRAIQATIKERLALAIENNKESEHHV